MPILKILPEAISNTASFVFGNVTTTSITANGVNLGTAVADAFLLANNANKSTTSNTAPSDAKVGDTWFDTVTGVILRYTNDGVSNNWIDISGPQNTGYIFQSYSITPNTTSINETSNTTVSYSVTSTNTADNTVLYWTNSGTTTSADFSDSVSNGTVTITNNSGTFTRSIVADLVTEGSETIVMNLRTGSNTGTVVAVAASVTVGDTSLDPYYAMFATGYNGDGTLGLDDRTDRSSPVQVGSGTNWRLIATGGYQGSQGVSAGIKTDGTLWLWGLGSYGRLGQGNSISRSSPTQVGALTSWSDVTVSTRGNHTMALRTDGTLWLWGRGNYGQLGQNNTSHQSSPVAVAGTNWSKIGVSAGVSAAIKTDGTLWIWGNNTYRRLGLNESSSYSKSSPTQLGANTNWASLSRTGGGTWMGAIKTDGTLWTWGGNYDTQTGSNRATGGNAFTGVGSPVQQTGSNWSRLAIGDAHGLGIKTDGTLWGWGNNSRSQLTNQVAGYGNITQIGTSTTWAEVSTAKYQTVALKTDGTIWAWGKNHAGMLGLNGEIDSYISSPRQIGSGTNWGAVATGSMTLLRTNSQ
jgi:alpha-tubulin suppressor-like RCC1 family protein